MEHPEERSGPGHDRERTDVLHRGDDRRTHSHLPTARVTVGSACGCSATVPPTAESRTGQDAMQQTRQVSDGAFIRFVVNQSHPTSGVPAAVTP